VGPDATQENVGVTDRDSMFTAPHAQDGLVLPQALRKASKQLIHAAGGAEHLGGDVGGGHGGEAQSRPAGYSAAAPKQSGPGGRVPATAGG
jgi:hypothetical protein